MPELRDIKDVELCREGTYDLLSGPVEFTRGRLETAVAAATAGGPQPRIKIDFADVHGPATNQPSLGNLGNLRLVEDGDVLTVRGDMLGMPAWLADIAPSALASRSIEASATGDSMRINALELLGVTAPGVKDIEDLKALYDGEPEGLLITASGPDANGTQTSVLLTVPVEHIKASANLDDLRRAFEQKARASAGPFDRSWWWVREVRIDPNELIVSYDVYDGGSGEQVLRVPWTANADGTFTFGDPIEVVVTYVDKVSASSPRVAYKAEASARPHRNQKEHAMELDKSTLEKLGLAEDATDEAVTAKLDELLGRKTDEQHDEAIERAKREAIAASKAPEGFTQISKDDLETLKASAARFEEANEARLKVEDTEILASAVKSGKFGPATRDRLATQMDKNREETRRFIAELPDGTVSVAGRSEDVPDDIAASGSDDDAFDAYRADHFGLKGAK